MNNQRSTPKKFQNFAEESNMKASRDIVYDELQHFKNEMHETFIVNNKSINQVGNSVSENSKTINTLSDKVDQLFSYQKAIKEENQILIARCSELEMRIKTFENVKDDYHMLKRKVDEICSEVRERKNQPSIEDEIKKSLVEFTDKINCNLEDNMNRMNKLFITNFTNEVAPDNKASDNSNFNTVTEVSSLKPIPPNSSNKAYSKVDTEPEVSSIKTTPVNLSKKESPKKPEKSFLDSNKNVSENTTSLLDSTKSISKSSPVKDINKSSNLSTENQNGFSFLNSTNKPLCSPMGVSNLTSNQVSNSLFGGKQQTNIFTKPADLNKSPNNVSLFDSAGQSNKLFGNKNQTLFSGNTLFAKSSDTTKSSSGEGIFGLNPQKSNLTGSTNKPKLISDSPFNLSSQPFKVDITNKEPNINSIFSGKPMSQSSATDYQSTKPSFSFTAAANSNTPSFSSLSQSAGDSNSFASNAEATWQGGSKLFAHKLNTSENEDNTEQNNQDEEHDPHFQPIIDLPPLVALQKDEESHDILFKSRCKLYRFTGSEWKERGVGEMKILRTKESIDPTMPVKLLMRRDQVRKICCNQRISKNVPTFAEMPNVKSTCWVGNDFSDGEPTQEKFAIRFSHADELAQFKRIVEEIQAGISSADKTD